MAKQGGVEEAAMLSAFCRSSLQKSDMKAALFFGEKALAVMKRLNFSDCRPQVAELARVYFLTGQYLRAYELLQREGLLQRYTEGNLLAAKCLLKAGDPDGALELIGEEDEPGCKWQEVADTSPGAKTVKLSSRTAGLRGVIFEAVENRPQAAHWYVEALRRDAMNYEAFATATDKHLLNAEQEEELTHIVRNSGAASTELLWEMYGCKLNVYASDTSDRIAEIAVDVDLMTARAQALYYACRVDDSLALCKKVFDVQADNVKLLCVYLACLVEKREANELYYLSHQLVEAKPGSAESWYSVGCYYLLIGKYDHSRHYFRRCTSTQASFGEGWMGYAHAFALQGEHDQAMAAYRASARMISNCHLPALCIGMEYLRVKNLGLAMKFVDNAKEISPNDPLIYNEMGIVHYNNENYPEALKCFRHVFHLVGEKKLRQQVEWEPTVFNAGHALRKMKLYSDALRHFSLALTLKPNNPSTLTAIGLTYHVSNVMDKAIEYYHLALGQKSDDAFTNDMLKRALESNWDIIK